MLLLNLIVASILPIVVESFVLPQPHHDCVFHHRTAPTISADFCSLTNPTTTTLRVTTTTDHEDDTIVSSSSYNMDGNIPSVLHVLKNERPYLSDEILQSMCDKVPLLKEGMVFRLLKNKKKEKFLENVSNDNDNDLVELFDKDLLELREKNLNEISSRNSKKESKKEKESSNSISNNNDEKATTKPKSLQDRAEEFLNFREIKDSNYDGLKDEDYEVVGIYNKNNDDDNNEQKEELSSSESLASTRKNYKCIPMSLREDDIRSVVSELIDDCGYTEEDVCYMFTIHPNLVAATNVKQNYDCLVSLGLSQEWVMEKAKTFPGIFHYDVPGKVRVLRSLGFDDGNNELLIDTIRKSNLRIFSYDIGLKLHRLREEYGFDDNDIKKLIKRGGNIFGMDLKKRFQKLQDVGFQDVISLVKRYPQLLALRTKTITQFVEAGIGLSYDDVVDMAQSCPSILGLNAERALNRLEKLVNNPSTSSTSQKKRTTTIGKLIKAFPQALTYDVDNRVHRLAMVMRGEQDTIIPPSPQELENARILLGKMFVQYPPILGYDLRSRIALLEDAGIPRIQALKALSKFPQLVSYDAASRISKLQEFGLKPPLCSLEKLGKLIGSFPSLIGYDIEKKASNLEKHIGAGLNRTQVIEMIVTYPRIVGVNAENTAGPAANFILSHYKDITIDYLVLHPRILTRSVENCLEPRLRRIQEIEEKKENSKKSTLLSPTTLVNLSNKEFEKKYGKLG